MPDRNRGAVLVSGASKGIGLAIARRLASRGFRVYGEVRNENDAGRIASKRIVPVTLDVTAEPTIIATAARIAAAEPTGLSGLVNNAGIAVPAPLEYLPLDDLRHQLEVNVVGQLAVTQAMLPLLRRAHGRIVNIGSISDRIVSPITGAYSISKFAFAAMNDGLRQELAPFGIRVILIEPGGIKTPIWQTALTTGDRLIDQLPEEMMADYGQRIRAIQNLARRQSAIGAEPDTVARVVAQALIRRNPTTRYLVGQDAKWLALLARLPDRLRDWFIAQGMDRGRGKE